MSRTTLPRPTLLAVAVAAQVDPRTVVAYLTGASQRPASRAAVERGLRKHGRADLVRPQASTAA